MKVSVEEQAAEVAVLLNYNVDSDAKCAGVATATLAGPLGTRLLTNATTGQPLFVIEDLRCSPTASFQRCDGVTVGTEPG